MDPELTEGGHRQAQETAQEVLRQGQAFQEDMPWQVLASPFVRCIQTATPLAQTAGVEICVEEGLAEIRYGLAGSLPSPEQRKDQGLPVDVGYTSVFTVCTDESRDSDLKLYMQRMRRFAPILERHARGRRTACVSHAASLALVAALLRCQDLDELGPLPPCGIFRLELPRGASAWRLAQRAGPDAMHLSPPRVLATVPWDFGRLCHIAGCLERWRALDEEEPLEALTPSTTSAKRVRVS